MMRALLVAAVVILCLVPAAAAQLLAFGFVGGGHGWLAPFPFSLLLWLAYPAVGIRLASRRRWTGEKVRRFDHMLLGVALAADAALLLLNDWTASVGGFWAVHRAEPGFTIAWLLLWLGWQAVPAWATGRRFLDGE